MHSINESVFEKQPGALANEAEEKYTSKIPRLKYSQFYAPRLYLLLLCSECLFTDIEQALSLPHTFC